MAAPEDRISRLNRALQILHPQQQTMTAFAELEQNLRKKIQDTENKLQNELRRVPTVFPVEIQQDLLDIKNELAVLQTHRRHIITMVYNTIRDTYNADAAPIARVDCDAQ